MGLNAGYSNQGTGSIAIGYQAGSTGLGQYSIAIGQNAAYGPTGLGANSIMLNASSLQMTGGTSRFYVNPIRSISGSSTLNQGYAVMYNPITKELYIA
jgi:hypothetical protein